MPSVTIYVLSHLTEILDTVPDWPFLHKVHLPSLVLDPPDLQTNLLGEGRAFLADLRPETEYVGFLNGRLPWKYTAQSQSWERTREACETRLHRGGVLVPWGAQADWAGYSEVQHPGICHLLNEMAEFAGLPIYNGRVSLWGNDFLCHRDVWYDWREFWRKVFWHFHGKYGFDLPFPTVNLDASRKPAYLYERSTCLFFSHRLDVNIEQL